MPHGRFQLVRDKQRDIHHGGVVCSGGSCQWTPRSFTCIPPRSRTTASTTFEVIWFVQFDKVRSVPNIRDILPP